MVLQNVNARDTSSGVTVQQASGATALLVVGGLCVEAQILIAVLAANCGEWDWSLVGYARYLVSPFVDLGPAWGAIGGVGVGVAMLAVHGAVWAVLHVLSGTDAPVSQGRMWFPGASIVGTRMLVVGVVAHISEVASDGELRGSTLGAAAIAVGVLYCVAVVIGHCVCLWVSKSTLTYVPTPDSAVPTSVVRRVFLNQHGGWEPSERSGRVAGVISPYRGGHRSVMGVVSPVVCVIASVVLGAGGCTGGPLGVGILALCMSVSYGVTRPLRSTLQTCLTSVCFGLLVAGCVWEVVGSQGMVIGGALGGLRAGTMFALLVVAALRLAHEVVLWGAPVCGLVRTPTKALHDLDSYEHNTTTKTTNNEAVRESNENEDTDSVMLESAGSMDAVQLGCDDGVVVLDEGEYIVMSVYQSHSPSLATSQADLFIDEEAEQQ